jgi:hypothetical protein
MTVKAFSGEHCWMVRLNLPKTPQRSWRENVTVNVIAKDASRAIECALMHFGPGTDVWGVQHRGSGNGGLLLVAEEALQP